MTTNSLNTILDVIAYNSGVNTNLHKGQINTPTDNYNEAYNLINGGDSLNLGVVNYYIMIESSDPLNIIITNNSNNITIINSNLLIMTAALTSVVLDNTGTSQIQVKTIIA